jgi:hypothetical protein
MKAYLIYSNVNGVDSYLVHENESFKDIYRNQLDVHGDSYYETEAFQLVIENNNISSIDKVYLAEFEDWEDSEE